MSSRNFFAELKRRNVQKVAIAYAVVAWLFLQAASILFPTFEAPPWVMKVFAAIIVFSFPIALFLAQAYELTPEGIKRTEDVDPRKSIRRLTGRKLDFLIIGVLATVVAVLIFHRLHPHVSRAAAAVSEKSLAPAVCILALIDAGLGRKEEALRESRRAVELVPMAKDSLNGADMIQYSAIVAAWVGEKDLALQNLAEAAQLPGFLSYRRLKLLPWWDLLRGDPL